jgi:phenylpropionate dioxygenase-like ring-hydroxylating dioxygenase large terminal subunit
LVGDTLVCGYHGMSFDAQGVCVSAPGMHQPPPSACVRRYPSVWRHRLLWFWPGDPALADESMVPDWHEAQHAQWAADGRLMTVACDWRLVIDNLMDLTHESFVHSASIGQRELIEAPFDVSHHPRGATVTRYMRGVQPPPFWAEQIKGALGYSGLVDRWQIIRFDAPATVVIDVGVAIAGTGAVPAQGADATLHVSHRRHGVTGRVLNTLTPGRGDRCHYFWAFARNHLLHDQALTTRLRDGVARIFAEDGAVLEAQQQALTDDPGSPLRNLHIDAGGLWARRAIDAMVAAEHSPARA